MPAYYSLYGDVQRQRAFVKKVLEDEIRKAKSGNDGTLDEDDFNKIRNYYGFGVPSIVGEGICTLRGRPMSDMERMASSYQGALTGLYDDFFDKTKIAHDEIRKMMDDPELYYAESSLENLFVHFLKTVHNNISNRKFFSETFDKVYAAQIATHGQLDPDFSWDDIKNITFLKGGVSLMFYRSAFDHDLINGEEEVLYNTGSLMQLGNDIFDVYKDEVAHIGTLLTRCKHISEVRAVFQEQLNKTIMLVRQSGFDKGQKRKFLRKLVLGISRCFVCLDQLENLQPSSRGKFKPSEYSREEMICDMEKPANMFRSVSYYLSYKF